jgi:hypothetical protein
MAKERTYNLFLDDIREPGEAFLYTQNSKYVDLEWVVVRNYPEFVNEISQRYINGELPELISFDHDLAKDHYEEMINPSYNDFGERTGYHCAKWLVDFCIDTDTALPNYLIHSMNPAGSANILSLLKSFECDYCGGRGYHKMSCSRNYIHHESNE